MLTIALESARFFAFHGLYQEEQVLGNHFILDVQVSIPEPEHPSMLSESVNYEELYNIACGVMKVPQPLLEQVVHDITAAIRERYPAVAHSKVTLRKQAPPFGGDLAYSVVSLEKHY
ncbi:dihydroneopterin aldolase [Chitinophaga sp. GCM10012297]|uniref:Dihydroneopterin aldolase n=1 Tax=Chitinophaga chungangae TaxID=2821488 RepID=A0ABS3Y9T8_9BACT|nr:dihydroneopterin aldolase [Chitinophaga chungangae]MBO9151439.1 dihydroneopterin aldolase [Chitinophaga chungangae]